MRIAINASCLEGSMYGVARYLWNVIDVWSRVYRDNRYLLFFRDRIPKSKMLERDCIEYRLVPRRSKYVLSPIWENFVLARAISQCKDDFDVFFSPTYTLPLFGTYNVMAVHMFDISFWVHPEWSPIRERLFYRFVTPPSTKRANAILTGSEFSRSEISSYLSVEPNRIFVTYAACGQEFRPISDKARIVRTAQRCGVSSNYVLFVGLVHQRRNIFPLIEAFVQYKQNHPHDLQLLIAGANQTYPAVDLRNFIRHTGSEDDVKYVDHVDDTDLPTLYSGASVFVYPSEYEGFGIPPLEAMACGTPVITARKSSLPEIVGEAALLVDDPSSVDQLTKALEQVLSDAALRERLGELGMEQACRFSWPDCARRSMQALEWAASSGRFHDRAPSRRSLGEM